MAHVDGSLSDRVLQALCDGRSDLAMAMAFEPLFALWSAIVAAAHHPDPSHPDYQLIEWRYALVQAIDDIILAAYAGVGIAADTDGRLAPAAGPLRRYTPWETGEVLIGDVLDHFADDPVVAAQSALLVFLRPYADLAELAMRGPRHRRKALRVMGAWRQALPQLVSEYCEAADRAMADGKDPVWACRWIPAWIQRQKDAL
jgi:hypothetical protein